MAKKPNLMKFKIEKKGYSTDEVDTFFASQKNDYDRTLSEQKGRIIDLKSEVASLEKDLRAYKEKSSLVSKAILSAVSKAEEIERLSQIKYNQEISLLKAFHEKWTDYYNKILDRYPLDDQLAAAGKFNRQMSDILSRASNSENIGQLFPVADAEKNFEKERDRLEETQIGYIKVKSDDTLCSKSDASLLNDIIPGADPNSPIMSGNFDPMERITRYLTSTKAEKPDKSEPKPAKSQNSALPNDYPDRSPSGFSLLEAQNPQQDLEDIMKDLGLL